MCLVMFLGIFKVFQMRQNNDMCVYIFCLRMLRVTSPEGQEERVRSKEEKKKWLMWEAEEEVKGEERKEEEEIERENRY